MIDANSDTRAAEMRGLQWIVRDGLNRARLAGEFMHIGITVKNVCTGGAVWRRAAIKKTLRDIDRLTRDAESSARHYATPARLGYASLQSKMDTCTGEPSTAQLQSMAVTAWRTGAAIFSAE